jgi:hypothetical protein
MFSSFLANSFFVLNWTGFVWVSFVMASGKDGLSVFLTLPWGSFLTELSTISPQGHVDSGSVWIAWLIQGPCWVANTHFKKQAATPKWMLPVWSKTKGVKLSRIPNCNKA